MPVKVIPNRYPLLRVQRSIIPFTSPNTRVRTLCFVKHPLVRQQPHRYLIGYGVREVISAGSCGALEKFPESTFLVPNKALRDEGTSYHYAPPSRFVEISEKARKAIEETILEHSMKYQEVITWSTDGFFRETKEKVAYRKSEGCAVVEMECSALAACADFRGATWGMILYTADSLADVDKYDERNWGGNAYEYALTLCLDAVIKL